MPDPVISPEIEEPWNDLTPIPGPTVDELPELSPLVRPDELTGVGRLLEGFGSADLQPGRPSPRQHEIVRYDRITEARDSAQVADRMSKYQQRRGWTDDFVREFNEMSRDDKLQALGDLLISPTHQEGLGAWWDRTRGGRSTGRHILLEGTPILSSILDQVEADELLNSMERIAYDREDDSDILRALGFIMDAKSEPSGIGSQAGQIAFQSLPFMVEMMLTRKVFTGARAGSKKLLTRALSSLAQKGLSGKVVRGGIETVGFTAGTAAQAAANPWRIRANMLHRMLPGLDLDDAGRLSMDLEAGDEEFEAFFGAALDTFIEFASERSGGLLGVANRGAIKFGMKSAMIRRYAQKVGDLKFTQAGATAARGISKVTTPTGKFEALLKRGAYDGIFGEIFEERVGDVARIAVGETTWEEVSGRWKDWENWAAEAIAFAMPLVGTQSIAALSGQLKSSAAAAETARQTEDLGGQSAQDIAYEALDATTDRPGLEHVDPTATQESLRRIHARDGGNIDAVTRTALLERGGPYTTEEQRSLDMTDSQDDAQPPGQMSHDEMSELPKRERDQNMDELEEIVQSRLTPAGKAMASDDPRLAKSRRALAELYRIQRLKGEVRRESVEPEPSLPLPDRTQQPSEPALEEEAASPLHQSLRDVGAETETQDLFNRLGKDAVAEHPELGPVSEAAQNVAGVSHLSEYALADVIWTYRRQGEDAGRKALDVVIEDLFRMESGRDFVRDLGTKFSKEIAAYGEELDAYIKRRLLPGSPDLVENLAAAPVEEEVAPAQPTATPEEADAAETEETPKPTTVSEALKEGKRQGITRAVERSSDVIGRIFGAETGAASEAEIAAMNRALLARTPEQVTSAAVALIRAQAKIQRSQLHAAMRQKVAEVRTEGKEDVRAVRAKEKVNTKAVQAIKDMMLGSIRDSGLSAANQKRFNTDLVAASTPAALGRALKKIDFLAARERFDAAVSAFQKAEAKAKRSKATSVADRQFIKSTLDGVRHLLFTTPGPTAVTAKTTTRKRGYDDADSYDNATSAGRLAAELVQERLSDLAEAKRQRGGAMKTTRDQDVAKIRENLGYDANTDSYRKELKVSKHMEVHENRDRSEAWRWLRAEAYEDTETNTRRAEGWQRTAKYGLGEEMGVLTRLVSRRMKEQEEEYNSELRDETRAAEVLLKEAGFRNMSDAYERLMGTFGRSNTEMKTVVLGGQEITISLDEVLEFLALDSDTLAKIAGGREIKLLRQSHRQSRLATIDEINQIRDDYVEYQPLVDALKARLEVRRARLFSTFMRLKGYEPEYIPGYWPTHADHLSTDNAGLAQAYRNAKSFDPIMGKFTENLGLGKERDEHAKAPLVISGMLSKWLAHTDQSLKIIHMAEATREASGVVMHPNVADAITRTSGEQVYRNLQVQLAEASLAGRDTTPGGPDLLQTANGALAGTYILTNPGTYIRQLGGISKMWTEMPSKYFAIGVSRIMRPGTYKRMKQQSGFFWARYSGDSISRYSPVAGTTLDGLDEIGRTQALKAMVHAGRSRDLRGVGKSWNRMLRTIKFIDWFDSIPARIAWEGFWAMSEDQHPEWTATRRAKWVSVQAAGATRSSQNTSSPLDAGGVVMNTRESAWRYFFLFTTDPMKSLNQLKQGWHESPGAGLKASVGVFGNVIWSAYSTNLILELGSEMLGTMISVAFGDDPDERLRQARLMRAFEKANFRAMRDVFGLLPVAGDAFAGLVELAVRGTRAQGSVLEAPILESVNDTFGDFGRELGKARRILMDKGLEEEFYFAVFEATRRIGVGGADLVGNPLHMPYYRARRIFEVSAEANPDWINWMFDLEPQNVSGTGGTL